MKGTTLTRLGILCSLFAITGQSQAGELTGSIALDVNTHFISYGLDVWGIGDDLDQLLFNPSLSFNYQVSEALSFNAGIWMDINNQVSGTGINSQETDVWVGVAYDAGLATFTATFQNWQYGGTSEEILDVGVSFDTFLNPSLLIHGRLGEGAAGFAPATGSEGVFLVGSIGHDIAINESWSLGLSSSVGFAATTFHTDETGFGYASFGAKLNYALNDSTSLYGGLTYYITDEDVTGNADNEFLSATGGVSFSF